RRPRSHRARRPAQRRPRRGFAVSPSATRLLLLNGAPAYRRLAGIVAGVAVGTGMLLILLGAFLHIPDRETRTAWMTPQGTYPEWDAANERVPRTPTDDTILVAAEADTFAGSVIQVVTVASTATTEVDFPGSLPAVQPGQYYASPALAALIESTPEDQLGDRWGEFQGELPADVTKGPSHLVILAGEE